jgi:trans-aconitate methyltransferase
MLSLTKVRASGYPSGAMTSAGHWDEVFAQGDEERSECEPTRSLEAITAIATPSAPIIDVGGGSSHLAALLRGWFTDITVLDLSATGLELARQRLGPDAERIHWIAADLLDWTPQRQFAIWHDRALLHFFTDPVDRHTYAQKVRDALDPGGHAIITTFAPTDPTTAQDNPCTGVARATSSTRSATNSSWWRPFAAPISRPPKCRRRSRT